MEPGRQDQGETDRRDKKNRVIEGRIKGGDRELARKGFPGETKTASGDVGNYLVRRSETDGLAESNRNRSGHHEDRRRASYNNKEPWRKTEEGSWSDRLEGMQTQAADFEQRQPVYIEESKVH